MIRSILVSLDGSELAEAVLPYAELIGKRTGAELVLLTSIHEVDGYLAQVESGKWAPLVQEYLESTRDQLQTKGVNVKTEIAFGAPAEVILDYAADEEIDLIAMSTHGRSGVSRWLLGSVADKVLHATHRPLLLIRPGSRSEGEYRVPTIEKILLPLDGSPLSLAILPFVEDLAKSLGASLLIVHVLPLIGGYPGVEPIPLGSLLQTLQVQADQFLTKVEKEVKQRGLEASHRVSVGLEVGEIVRAASDAGADMIALSTHGRSGLGRWTMGSVADAIVRRTYLPCLVVRPQQAEKVP